MTAPGQNAAARARARSGMTLVEVLLAVAILGICLTGLMQGMGACMEVFRSSAFVHQAHNALARAEALFPVEVKSDPEEDLAVDSEEIEDAPGWTYSRTCEEDDDEDSLYVLRSRVSRGRGGPGAELELVQLLYLPGYGD